jgi:hypothetical protein
MFLVIEGGDEGSACLKDCKDDVERGRVAKLLLVVSTRCSGRGPPPEECRLDVAAGVIGTVLIAGAGHKIMSSLTFCGVVVAVRVEARKYMSIFKP